MKSYKVVLVLKDADFAKAAQVQAALTKLATEVQGLSIERFSETRERTSKP